jgi:small subunit ribosomal protein S18
MNEQSNPIPQEEEVVETSAPEEVAETPTSDEEVEASLEPETAESSPDDSAETPVGEDAAVQESTPTPAAAETAVSSEDGGAQEPAVPQGSEEPARNLRVEGPSQYVQRERGGRVRRIGGDVRPEDVDYKNIPLLSRFLDRRGRILSRRKTRVSAKVQRRIVTAIKRARHLALLPYTADQTRIVRKRR